MNNIMELTQNKPQIKKDETTGKKFIEFNADVFIVPNSPIKAKEKYHDETDFFKKVNERNNLVFDEDEDYIQCWLVSNELNTENFSDHGGLAMDENGDEIIIYGLKTQYIPSKLFKDKKEGDEIIFISDGVYKEQRTPYNQKSEGKIELRINLKLNQSDYRYARFGTFEEVLKNLCH